MDTTVKKRKKEKSRDFIIGLEESRKESLCCGRCIIDKLYRPHIPCTYSRVLGYDIMCPEKEKDE